MKKLISNSILFIVLIITVISCGPTTVGREYKPNPSFAETIFQVRLSQPLIEGEEIYLEIVDEVTGIGLNPSRYKMSPIGSAEFSLNLPLSIGSLVKYRYLKRGSSDQMESDIKGSHINYRLYLIKKPSQVNDLVAGWNSDFYSGETGEISGYVYDQSTEAPLGEILISINGIQTYTSFDGFYKFDDVPLGEYSLVAMHIEGDYEIFQQNAIVAHNSITPASFGLTPAKKVNITFNVSVPEYTEPNAVIKFIGNTFTLGNSFAVSTDGGSVLSSRSPGLTKNKNGSYSITLKLPSGFDLRYKYSLGDGFINAEHLTDGSFNTRQLIIPDHDASISGAVESWYSSGTEPVKFLVKTPQNTPENDVVDIQLNPYTWMQPTEMWKIDNNEWTYTLYSPLEYLNQAQYRFCRNHQCGIADDDMTKGKSAAGYILDFTSGKPQNIVYQIDKWFGLGGEDYYIDPNVNLESPAIKIKGFEISSPYNYQWFSSINSGLIAAGVAGGNWIFFSPTWIFNTNGISEFKPTECIFSEEILRIIKSTNEAGLSLALYPKISFTESYSDYWSSVDLSYNWWQNWFDNYQRFVLNYVDFATQAGVNTIIIGGKEAAPSFPDGKLLGGSNANIPIDFNDRWINLINIARSRFAGQIGIAVPYSTFMNNTPGFINNIDFIYIEMDSLITESATPSIGEIEEKFNKLLDNQLYNLYATYQKPVLLGIDYFSIDGSASNCLNHGTSCSNLVNNGSKIVDSMEQADIYQGILRAATSKPWIYGIITKGYNPSVQVQDLSNSVHGKPALQVLSYFFNRIK